MMPGVCDHQRTEFSNDSGELVTVSRSVRIRRRKIAGHPHQRTQAAFHCDERSGVAVATQRPALGKHPVDMPQQSFAAPFEDGAGIGVIPPTAGGMIAQSYKVSTHSRSPAFTERHSRAIEVSQGV